MHPSSLENMRLCYARYVAGTPLEQRSGLTVLDVGGADINGSFREIFANDRFSYVSADLASGPGVTLVLDDAYHLPFEDGSVDLVVSGSMLEHCEFFWLAFAEMIRVLKPDGLLFAIAPSSGFLHRHPVDCYRFYPDAYRALAKYVGCRLVDLWWDDRAPWHDVVGVFGPRAAVAHGANPSGESIQVPDPHPPWQLQRPIGPDAPPARPARSTPPVRAGAGASLSARSGRARRTVGGLARRIGLARGQRNPLFDQAWYLLRYPEVLTSGREPFQHYRSRGWHEYREPNSFFDPAWYLRHYPDVARSGMEPLDHYLRFGAADGRDPSPRFKTRWYMRRYGDVPAAYANPLLDYLNTGASDGRLPRPSTDQRPSIEASAAPTARVGVTRPVGKQAIVHVGTHKTGSTSFQRYLDRHRRALLADHGLLVHAGCFAESHFELSALTVRRSLETPGRWLLNGHGHSMAEREMREAIRRTVESAADTVIFSIEELCYLRTDEEVEALRDLLSPRMVMPLVVLRRPSDYLSSYRVTLQEMGFSGPSSDPGSVAYTLPDSWLVDYPALLATLRRLGAGEEPHVVDYDLEMARDGSIIPALMAGLGIGSTSLYPGWQRFENVSLWRDHGSAAA